MFNGTLIAHPGIFEVGKRVSAKSSPRRKVCFCAWPASNLK